MLHSNFQLILYLNANRTGPVKISQRAVLNVALVFVAICLVTIAFPGGVLAQNTIFSQEPAWVADLLRNIRAVALGDVDGDGDLDLISGNGGDRYPYRKTNLVYLNNAGTFSSIPDWYSSYQLDTRGVAVGDVNMDGGLDLVCANYGQSNTLYLNSGVLFWTVPAWFSTALNNTRSVTLGDVDLDGDLDLVCGNNGQSNTLYLNNAGSFSTTPDWSSGPANYTTSVVLGDVDNDGDLDLVCGNGDEGIGQSNTLYFNNGGTFSSNPDWSSQSLYETQQVLLGDIDGDGNFDLVCGNKSGDTFGQVNTVYLNDGYDFSDAPSWVSGRSYHTTGIVLGDVDGDTDLDLLCGHFRYSKTLYLNNNGMLSVQPDWTDQMTITTCITLGDIDNDGDLDLIYGNDYPPRSELYINETGLLSYAPSWYTLAEYKTNCIAIGDLDNDGYLDVACGNYGQSNNVYMNNNGTLSNIPNWQSGPTNKTNGIDLGDVNGDGDPDLVCGNSGQNTLYLNVEGRLQEYPVWSSNIARSTKCIELADIDGDGDLDLICGNIMSQNTIYRNEEGVFLSSPSWESNLMNWTSSIDIGDIDSDGDLDLVFGSSREKNTLYLNQNGTFSAHPDWFSGSVNFTWSIALGDVDGDGDLDLFCGNVAQKNTIYLNEGGVLATEPSWESSTVRITYSVAFFDADGDGDLDLLCGNHNDVSFTFLNQWGLYSTPLGWTDLGWFVTSVAFGDIDCDGDRDLVCGSFGDPNQLGGSNQLHESVRAPYIATNPTSPANHLTNNTAFISILRLEFLGTRYRMHATVIDVESDPVWIFAEYQFKGVSEWFAANSSQQVNKIGPLASSPVGMEHQFDWDVLNFPHDNRDVILRLRIISHPTVTGTIQHVATYHKEIGIVKPERPQISTNTDHIRFPTITVGDFASVNLSISNIGLTNLTIYNIELPSTEMRVSSALPIEISPGTVDVITVYSEPVQSPSVSGDMLITSNDPIDPVLAIPVQGNVRSLEFSLVNLYPDGIIDQERAMNVSLVMQDSVTSDSALVYYRNCGKWKFKTIRMGKISDPVNDQYTVSIPADLMGLSGLEYFPAAFNHAAVCYGELERLRLRAWNLSFLSIQQAMEYSMVSIPLEIQGTFDGTLSDDLGGRDIETWRMFYFQPDQASYVELPNDTIHAFQLGQSYWLVSKNSAHLNTGPPLGLTAPPDSAYEVILRPGWNMIGNPFNFPVAWDSCLVDTMTMSEAETTVVESPVRWVAEQGYRYDVDVLEPFEGYWIKNLDTVDAALKIPPREAPEEISGMSPLLLAGSSAGVGETDWQINIGASSVDAVDAANVVGVRESASNQWDHRDRSEPPQSPGHSISLYFPHGGWGMHPGNYTMDIRGEYKAVQSSQLGFAQSDEELWGHLWYFDVAKNFSGGGAGDEVTLAFDGFGNVPAEAAIYLVDRHLGRLVDLRTEKGYSFFLGKREVVTIEEGTRFMLLVGSEEFVGEHEEEIPELPAATTFHANYPNPFNPSTVIRYDIARPCQVELRIYDTRGVIVKVLYSGRREPGIYEAGWNGKNENGLSVTSGVYFCRLTAGTITISRKLVLLR